jgi:hypothetical protein
MKIIIFFVAMVSAAHAISNFDTLTTKSGRTYETVKVTKQDPDGIRITHSEGAAKVFFTDLPDDILAVYDYNPDAAKAYQEENRQRIQKANAERQAAAFNEKVANLLKEQAIIFTAEIFQVVPGGILAKNAFASEEVEVEREKLVSKGLLLKPEAKQLVQWKEKVNRQTPLSPDEDQMIFVECNPAGFVDSQRIGGIIWRTGAHSYITPLGSSKTVPKYTNDPSVAQDYLLGKRN